jgi:hypothetical protein
MKGEQVALARGAFSKVDPDARVAVDLAHIAASFRLAFRGRRLVGDRFLVSEFRQFKRGTPRSCVPAQLVTSGSSLPTIDPPGPHS